MRLALGYKKLAAFSLIELLIVLAIIGILFGAATPWYGNFISQTKFSQVITAAIPLKTAMELAVEVGGVTDINELDGGKYGIDTNILDHQHQYVGKIELRNGTLTIYNQNMPKDVTYKLVAKTIEQHQIVWSNRQADQGSCVSLGWC
jgi:prepilin-type N-terminal cleavage/methylation domain-containing protein